MTVVAQKAHVSKPLLVMAMAKTTVLGNQAVPRQIVQDACEGGGVS